MTQEEIDRRIIEPVKNNVAQLSQIAREVAVEMIHADKIHGYHSKKNLTCQQNSSKR